MPKLPKDVAKKALAADDLGEYDILPVGWYVVRLVEVEEREPQGEDNKGPYWSWKLSTSKQYHPDHADQWLWTNTSLSQERFVKRMFTAFGYTPDSDTDEIIDDVEALALVKVTHRKWNGEDRANVAVVAPFVDDPALLAKKYKIVAADDADEDDDTAF